MKNFLHVAVGGDGCLLWVATVLTRAQVRRVPVPPVMLSVRLLVLSVVLLRLVEELGKGCYVHGCLRQLPFAARKSGRDFLE
jgi:hypothetical protein